MRNTLLALALCSAICAQTRAAKQHELSLRCDGNADAYISLRHPSQTDDTSNTFASLDCGVLNPAPDWGVRGRTDDDPVFHMNPVEGGRKIAADLLNDPGACGVVVFVGAGAATCTVNVASWPGVPTQSFTHVVSQGQLWYVTNLPLARDIKLRIRKVKQHLRGAKWGWITIQATFDDIGALSVTSNFLRVSVKNENIVHYDEPDEVRVNRKGTVAWFGHPARAMLINKKANTLVVRGPAKMIYQNAQMPVLVAFKGWSGGETVQLDGKARYTAPKD